MGLLTSFQHFGNQPSSNLNVHITYLSRYSNIAILVAFMNNLQQIIQRELGPFLQDSSDDESRATKDSKRLDQNEVPFASQVKDE